MEIKQFASHGRRLIVEFKCYRCKTTATRPLEECMEEQREFYQGLHDLKPPKEWEDGGFYYPLFCPECAEAYKRFMNSKGGAV